MIIALALIIFGPGKLPDVGRAVGKAMSEFKNASREIEQEIKKYEDDLNRQKKKINLLKEVPCGEEYSHCKFIKDAYAARQRIANVLVTVEAVKIFVAPWSTVLITKSATPTTIPIWITDMTIQHSATIPVDSIIRYFAPKRSFI